MRRPPLSRRELIAGTVGAGFALAVRPISATTITTSADELDVADVRIAGPGGDIPAYVALPARRAKETEATHRARGARDLRRARAHPRRLPAPGEAGYLAIAPDLFARQGDVAKMRRHQGDLAKVVSKVPDEQVLGDLDAALAWAQGERRRSRAKSRSPASAGAGASPGSTPRTRARLKAGVAWYGRLVGDKDPLHPLYPIDVAATLKAPGAGPLRRSGPGHPARQRRGDAQGARGGRPGFEAFARSRSIPTRVTRSSPTTARATAPPTPPTAGSA